MDFELLDNIGQFKKLKRGDMILVKWSDYFVKHTNNAKTIMCYEIHEIFGDEIICQRKNNHYFNYSMYLRNESVAIEVYKVSIKESL